MGVRKSGATQGFLAQWEQAFPDDPIKADQRSLRCLLWKNDLILCPLPVEYNTARLINLLRTRPHHGAPRLLHVMALDKIPLSEPEVPFDLDAVLDPDIARHLKWLLRADYSLDGDPSLPRPIPQRQAMRRYMQKAGA